MDGISKNQQQLFLSIQQISVLSDTINTIRKFEHDCNVQITFLKCKGQIRARAAIAAINFFFALHSIVILNSEYGADVGQM